jgi:hypothetical protein
MSELEEGNHSPSDSIAERIGACIEICRTAGIEIRKERSDSAAYQSKVINDCDGAGRTYFIRADMDSAVGAECRRINDWGEHKVKVSKGKEVTMELGSGVHCMEKTDNAFSLVVKRDRVVEEDKKGQERLEGLSAPVYKYWCIATNATIRDSGEEGEGMTVAEVEEEFNGRCEVENRIKQIKRDVGCGRLPTSELGANRMYLYAMSMLHNLSELFKYECMAKEHRTKRLPTLMREVLGIPGKIVTVGHKMVIDLPIHMRHIAAVFQDILVVISEKVRAFERGCGLRRMDFGQMVFRRE